MVMVRERCLRISKVVVTEFVPSAPVANNRTPPPAYDIAILLPPVHPQDRVPSYEEVTTKRF